MKVPKDLRGLPKKMVLLGGGQFANQFIIVNVLEVHGAQHPMRGHESAKVLQARVEEQGYSGVEIFEPYLLSYDLVPLNDKYADAPLDTYLADFHGSAQGKYTKHLLKS